MRKKPRIQSVKEIAALIHAGAERLLEQAKYSGEYLRDKGSEIAEANSVVHLASTQRLVLSNTERTFASTRRVRIGVLPVWTKESCETRSMIKLV